MDNLPAGLLVLIVALQVVVFIFLVLVMIRLVKVIKSQNNGVVLPPDVSEKLRKIFGRSRKP